jgi:glycosyltransferase involved in cell wall biosynthesis
MRIAIYDAWLDTLGGGEKHILALAAALSREHEVDFYSHSHVDPTLITSALNVAIDKIMFCYAPQSPDVGLSCALQSYDLLINATHDSVLPNPSPKGLRFLFFPPPPPPRAPAVLSSIAAPLRRVTGLPEFGRGFYGPERVGGGWYRATTEEAELVIPGGAPRSLRFMAGNAGDDPAGKPLAILQGDRVLHETTIPPTGGDFVPVGPVQLAADDGPVVVTIKTKTDEPDGRPGALENRRLGLMIADPRTDAPLQTPVRVLLRRLSPELAVAMERAREFPGREALASYDTVVANSQYTAGWVRRWWGISARTVHPPVAPIANGPEAKRPEILSVGRFFAGSHNKNHDFMVGWFREMVRDGLSGWTLRLMGALGSRPADRDYLERVRELARGMPIEIRTDVPAGELAEAYRRAPIYWHAAGYGRHPRRDPERFEHFGISTVEAMSAGAAALVFDGGGLRETVEPGRSGYAWRTPAELTAATWRLVRDARLRRRLGEGAIARSAEFSPEKFETQIMAVVDELIGK